MEVLDKMYKTLDQKKDLAMDIERQLAPLVKRIEVLERWHQRRRKRALLILSKRLPK